MCLLKAVGRESLHFGLAIGSSIKTRLLLSKRSVKYGTPSCMHQIWLPVFNK